MDPLVVGILGVVALAILLFLGVHVAIALGLVGLAGMATLIGLEGAIYTTTTLTFERVSNYSLVIIPLYVLMGVLAQEGGLSEKAYNNIKLWTNKLPGGLGMATVGACTMFGTMCGSSLVTAAIFASTSAPQMRKAGYEKKFSYAICSASGVIGMLIPPSVLIVIYGILTRESIGKLLIGGIAPGLALLILFCGGIYYLVTKNKEIAPRDYQRVTWKQRIYSLKDLWGVLLVIVIVFGGIFFGIFSPSEAGAISCLVLLGIFLVSARNRINGLNRALRGTIATSAMIFLILIGAGIFSRFLVLSTIAPSFLGYVTELGLPSWGFLAIICVAYILMGCFFDSISMLSITLPIVHPAAMALGVDPIQFAMVVILAIEVGLITPPVGLNIYAVKGVAQSDVSLEDLFVGVLPFLFVMLFCLGLFIAFPFMSTFIPALMS